MTKNRPRSIEAIRRFGFRSSSSSSSSSNRRAIEGVRAFGRRLPASSPEISKREIPSISARSQQLSLLSGGIRFPWCGNRSNKESCSSPFPRLRRQKCCARARIDTHTHTHTQRPYVLYSHDIEKYVNLKKIYIYVYVYTYMYICISLTYVHYVYIM